MNTPFVTAVLICWNHERFVRAAILSAVRQTYPNMQLIVFDNDSRDNSRRVIEELRREYDFEFIHQENIGIVKTLNRALRMAKGKYFTGLACDDLWLLDRIERQVEFLEANPKVDMVCGHVVMIDENGQLLGVYPGIRSMREVTFADLMNIGGFVLGPTVMIRTKTLLDEGGYDESLRIEDYALALKFTHNGRRIVHTGEIYTLYRRHNTQWTSQPLFEDLLEIGHIYREAPGYKAYARRSFQPYFRMLAGERKAEAIRLWRAEPIGVFSKHIGIGMLKLACPMFLLRMFKKHFRRVEK